MGRFKSPRHAQCFLSVHDQVKKQSSALAATNYPPLPIDNLAQMLTAFGTTSRVS